MTLYLLILLISEYKKIINVFRFDQKCAASFKNIILDSTIRIINV